MRAKWILAALCLVQPFVLGVSCAEGDKFRTGKDLLGVVALGPFPKQAAGVAGYNLYIAKQQSGPWDKINDQPVLGFSSLMVPYLTPDQTYYFRMSSVSAKDPDKESAPGQTFSRKAVENGPGPQPSAQTAQAAAQGATPTAQAAAALGGPGTVTLGPFPKFAAGVGGYNLYVAKQQEGPFAKVNAQPILAAASQTVPDLVAGQTYYFRMTAVGATDPSKESVPGQTFARKAVAKAN